MMYLYRGAHEAAGFEGTVVPAEDDLTVRTDRFLDAIDGSTGVVAFSQRAVPHVLQHGGGRDCETRSRGRATVILDTYQSAGNRPARRHRRLDVDFAVGGCLKWLCGGPGNAFLYTRPELRKQLKPTLRVGVASKSVRVRTRTGRDRDVRAECDGE
jgi:kynureninase